MSMALQSGIHFQDIEQLADKIGDMLQCPITIEDVEHRLLGYSTHGMNVDAVRIATIVGRKVPEHVTETLNKNGIIDELNRTGIAQYIEVEHAGKLSSRIAIAVKHGARTLGYIWAVCGKEPMSAEWHEQLRHAAVLVSRELLRLESAKRYPKSAGEQFLHRLINGQLASNAAIHAEAAKLLLRLPIHGLLAVIQFEDPVDEDVIRKAFKRWLEINRMKPVCYAVFHECLVFLLDRDCEFSDDAPFIAMQYWFGERLQLLEYPATAIAGVSVIEQYDRTAAAYKRAIDAISIKKNYPAAAGHICSYEKLGYLHYLPAVTRFNRESDYEHPGIERLRKYDKEHASELVETLAALLDHDCQTKEVIKLLHIHPNTLSYRVQRIQEISGIDLKSMPDKVACYLYLKADASKG